MSAVSILPAERARKGVSLVLQRMETAGTGAQLAVSMGVSETTISRIKNERLEETLLLMAHLGLKCVPTSFRCVDQATYDFLTATHQRVMQRAPELIWDIEE